MSTKKKGVLTSDSEWRKHFRKFGKRFFGKQKEKQARMKLKKNCNFIQNLHNTQPHLSNYQLHSSFFQIFQ